MMAPAAIACREFKISWSSIFHPESECCGCVTAWSFAIGFKVWVGVVTVGEMKDGRQSLTQRVSPASKEALNKRMNITQLNGSQILLGTRDIPVPFILCLDCRIRLLLYYYRLWLINRTYQAQSKLQHYYPHWSPRTSRLGGKLWKRSCLHISSPDKSGVVSSRFSIYGSHA
jgi:hypothetical protein